MKKYKFIIVISCLFILAGCSCIKRKMMPTNNKGGYIVKLGKHEIKTENESVTVRGHVYDVKTNKPLNNATLITGCFKFQTTSEGEYSFRTRNLKGDAFFMIAVVYPHRAVETDYVDIYNRKEVIIDFYLAMDERPIIECEGVETLKRMQNELNNLK
ncbi:hypothetical protein [Flavobacterium notoginsengisoli]|uniref:hypothetical protein n=1 Tax=Flavobacterium notoginsengisoli TaxID=1478199 RepID=UPI003642CF0F